MFIRRAPLNSNTIPTPELISFFNQLEPATATTRGRQCLKATSGSTFHEVIAIAKAKGKYKGHPKSISPAPIPELLQRGLSHERPQTGSISRFRQFSEWRARTAWRLRSMIIDAGSDQTVTACESIHH